VDTIQCADSCASDAGCVSSSYCRASDHTCQPDQAKGATCTAASQCTSGNCVDGYCCDAPCSDLCQACSAAKTGGANGTCKGITKGNDPDGECPDDGPSSCARNGVCEAAGLCQKYTSGTACGSTACSMGMQAGYACDGAGTCKQNQSTSCDPYVCSGAACGDTCVSDADCIASAFCDSTSHCAADQANGAACSKNSQCKNGNCVDGVCCDQPCAELCQACSAAKKGSGSDGVCGNVKAESDPDNDCSADAPTTCQSDGHCDGQGACKKYGLGTVCGATECSGSQLTGHQCNGLGACVDGQSSCVPYVCLTSSCSASCGDDNGCVGGTYCAGSTCEPKLGNGSPCSGNRECSSTFCVEGVCCDTACNGVCQACTAANKASGEDGACDLAKVGSDAHDDCPDDGALSCKRDGLCDGAGECRRYEAGTACGITRCEGNVQTGFACDGGGKCEANTTNDCKLYACMSGACTVTCLDSNDCSASAYCDVAQGTCQEKQENGSACDEPGTCASGYCVDAVCCDKACAGQCQACDVATAPGTCSPIVGVPHGIRPACDPGTEGDVCSARACDGEQDTNSCVGYVGADTSCRDQTCAEGIETFSAACNGAGECGPAGPVKTKKCEPYVCQGQGCGSAPCAGDMDCAPKFRCDPNKHDCVPKDVASCDGDHVISNPDGTTTECAPFKCEGSVCKDSCASVDDCVSGFVCDAASHCVAASGSTSSGAGCGCRVADGRPERTPLWLLLLGVSLAARRRWRRRLVTVLRA
jgi:MYXO-CTERM domain-containing protein